MHERYQVVWSDGSQSDWQFTLEAAVAVAEDDGDSTGTVYDESEYMVWSMSGGKA
jgi:hypothetical protein